MFEPDDWEKDREKVTMTIPLALNAVTEVDVYEKYAFGGTVAEEASRMTLDAVAGKVMVTFDIHRLYFAPDEDDPSYDEEKDYDSISTALVFAVCPQGGPVPDSDYTFDEEDDDWGQTSQVGTIDVDGVLYDVLVLYVED